MATQNAINLKASGLASYDGAGTFAGRTIQQPAAGITVANGDGVSGDPTLALADDLAAVEGLSGSGVITRTGASAWSANSIADRAVVVGDTGNTVQGIGPLADGELLIGATGGAPAAAALTAGTAVDITNGTNSITIDFDVTEAADIPTSFTTDSGTATPAANSLAISGGTNIATSGTGAAVTIDFDGTLPVASGGTGATTLTGVLTGNGTSAVTASAVTEHSVLLGGASNAVSEVALGLGDLLIGANSAAPNDLTSWMQAGNNCWFWNLSFTHSAGTLTLAGADGTALSSTNPGFVAMASNATAGRIVLHTITANDTLTVSDMTGSLFGTTDAVAWGNAMPLYVGFMADASDANLEPIICRLPHLKTSPATSTDIGDPSAATADEEWSVFAWNDITEANYTSKQVGIIGSLRATKAVTTNAWTLTALDALDGAGKWNDSRAFTMVTGNNGAASGKYWADNGGTAPSFSGANEVYYWISKDGRCQYAWRFNTSSAASGTGAGILEPPYRHYDSSAINLTIFGVGQMRDSSSSVERTIMYYANSTGISLYVPTLVASGVFPNNNFDTGDNFRGSIILPLLDKE